MYSEGLVQKPHKCTRVFIMVLVTARCLCSGDFLARHGVSTSGSAACRACIAGSMPPVGLPAAAVLYKCMLGRPYPAPVFFLSYDQRRVFGVWARLVLCTGFGPLDVRI